MAPDFLIHRQESEAGVLEIREVDAGESKRVQLTIRESERSAGVSITVGREELEEALGAG